MGLIVALAYVIAFFVAGIYGVGVVTVCCFALAVLAACFD